MPKTNRNLQWNLGDLYASKDDPAIKQDFDAADEIIKKLDSYRSKIAALTPIELLELIKNLEDASFLFHKIGLFAGLLEATNSGVDEVTRFSKSIDEQIISRAKNIIFIDVELSHLPEEKWQEFFAAKELKPYNHYLEEIHKQAKHTLTEPEEKILAEKSQTSWLALSHLYEVTTTTLPFDWEGKQITLDELIAKFHDSDPLVRKSAAMSLHAGLQANNKTTPPIYNSLIQDKSIKDRLRHYSYPEETRFLDDEVDKETVQALVEAVTQSFDLVGQYYTLKKSILGVDELFWWDRYAPLPQLEAKISHLDAQKMVIDAYQAFSPRMAEIAETMFTQQHIDWLPSQTKRGGAFCAMTGREMYPYVLLNYTETPRDVMTLAHELGHAIHDVLAQEKNVFLQTHPSLALAEIASVFGESLLFEKLMDSLITSTKDKISLLMAFIEDRFATVFRQITMFQFEQQVHNSRREQGELSREQIDELWHETMRKPYSNALEFTDEHKNTWMYVSHIINTPFYVYSYAFAQLCVLALLQQYKKQGSGFVETYVTLLQSGGSLSPKDNLKQARLDITKPEFWQDGLVVIAEYVDRLNELTKS